MPRDWQDWLTPDAWWFTLICSLLEAVTEDELTNDEEYSEIVEDMRDECGKHGQVRIIPPSDPPILGPVDSPICSIAQQGTQHRCVLPQNWRPWQAACFIADK